MTSQQTDFFLSLWVQRDRTYFFDPMHKFKMRVGFFRLTGTPLGNVSVNYNLELNRDKVVKFSRMYVHRLSVFTSIMVDKIALETNFQKRQRLWKLFNRRYDFNLMQGAIALLDLDIS